MKSENKGRDYYRKIQQEAKEARKNCITYFWVSKLADRVINGKVEKNPLNKGRTYVKPKEEK